MKYFLSLLAITLCFACSTVNAQTLNCSKFKNGTFKMSFDGKIDTVIRKGELQTELFNGTHRGTFNVKWTEDCTYTLIPTAETFKAQPNLPANMIVTVKITKTTKTGYTQVVTNNLTAEEMTMDVEKIK